MIPGIVSPVDFWRLPPGQVWWLIENKLNEAGPTPGLSNSDAHELRNWVKQHNKENAETDAED